MRQFLMPVYGASARQVTVDIDRVLCCESIGTPMERGLLLLMDDGAEIKVRGNSFEFERAVKAARATPTEAG